MFAAFPALTAAPLPDALILRALGAIPTQALIDEVVHRHPLLQDVAHREVHRIATSAFRVISHLDGRSAETAAGSAEDLTLNLPLFRLRCCTEACWAAIEWWAGYQGYLDRL